MSHQGPGLHSLATREGAPSAGGSAPLVCTCSWPSGRHHPLPPVSAHSVFPTGVPTLNRRKAQSSGHTHTASQTGGDWGSHPHQRPGSSKNHAGPTLLHSRGPPLEEDPKATPARHPVLTDGDTPSPHPPGTPFSPRTPRAQPAPEPRSHRGYPEPTPARHPVSRGAPWRRKRQRRLTWVARLRTCATSF